MTNNHSAGEARVGPQSALRGRALALLALSFAEERPEAYDQQVWIVHDECGTTGCFAGLVTLLAGARPRLGDAARVYFENELWLIPDLALFLLFGEQVSDSLVSRNHRGYPLFDQDNSLNEVRRLVDELLP